MEACQQKMLNQEAKIDDLRRLRIEVQVSLSTDIFNRLDPNV